MINYFYSNFSNKELQVFLVRENLPIHHLSIQVLVQPHQPKSYMLIMTMIQIGHQCHHSSCLTIMMMHKKLLNLLVRFPLTHKTVLRTLIHPSHVEMSNLVARNRKMNQGWVAVIQQLPFLSVLSSKKVFIGIVHFHVQSERCEKISNFFNNSLLLRFQPSHIFHSNKNHFVLQY